MPGSVYQIKPGSPQQVTGAPLKDAVIWNNDLTNSIWLSSVQAMGPGSGIELPPQAYCHWVSSQVWACVDTGVSSPVQLQISNDVIDIENPVGIAEAIAIAGIPLLYRGAQLAAVAIVPGASITEQVAQYSSIQLLASPASAGALISLGIEWYADNAATQVIGLDHVSLGDDATAIAVGIWEMPVRGQSMKIFNESTSGGNVTVDLYGSNRPVTGLRSIYNESLPRAFGFSNKVVVAGTTYQITATDSLPNYTSLNGPLNVSVITAPSATTPQFAIDWVGFDGQVDGAVIGTSGAFQTTINHPATLLTWKFTAGANQTLSLALTIVPQSPV